MAIEVAGVPNAKALPVFLAFVWLRLF